MKDFEKNSILMLVLTMLANILNYLFQIVMGRILDVDVFGTFNSLLSLHTVVSVPVAAIVMVIAKCVAENNALGKSDDTFLRRSLLYTFLSAACLIVLGTAISPAIDSFMHIGSRALVIFMIFSAGSGFIIPVVTGGLQGRKKFLALGLVCLVVPLSKLIGSIIFMFIGLELYGIFLSIIFGNVITLLIGLALLRINFGKQTDLAYNTHSPGILKLISASFMVNLGWVLLTNMDVLLIKHYFTTEETGLYSVASVLGKMVFYVTGAIVLVMFPMVAEANARKDNSMKVLRKALLYGGSISLLCAVVLNIFSKFIITILFGSKYLNASEFIFPISLWVITVSFIVVLVNYALAGNNTGLMSVSLPLGCFTVYILTLFFNSTIIQIVYILTAVSFFLLLVNGISIIPIRRQKTYD